MRTLSIFLFLIGLLSLFLHAADPAPVYTLDVIYDAESRTLEGSFDLELVPETDVVYFSLLANLDAEPNPYVSPRQMDAVYPFGFEPSRISVLSVEQITAHETVPLTIRHLAMPPSWQTYSLGDTVLAVHLPETSVGTEITLRGQFFTEIPRTTRGDGGITDDVLTWRFGWFPMLFPEQSRLVEREGVIGYAGVESLPLVFPWTQISARFTHPADMRLITGADAVSTHNPDEAADLEEAPSIQVEVSNTSPSRSLAFTIGPSYSVYTTDTTPRIFVYYRELHERDARVLASQAIEILTDFEEKYGPYPRSSLTIVQNPTPHGQAFAADGILWLSSRFFTHQDILFPGALYRLTEFVLAHEIAHQWVGLGTGIDLDAEAWLSEGLAQYLSVRYFEDRYGSFEPNLFGPQLPGLVGEIVQRQWGFFNFREHFIELPYLLTLYAGFDEELIKPTENVKFGNAESVRLYDKGYLVARALEAKIGSDAFERGLQRAIDERRCDLLDARSFQALLEDASGQSLDAFFDFWVFGPGAADYSIHIIERSESDDVHTTRVAVRREGGVTQPIIIEATMASEGTVRQTWDGAEDAAELEFTTPSLVTRVSIDPDHEIPDRDRLNNHDPVKIVGAVNENALPLDAYVLAPQQATGGVSFSHLDRLRVSLSQTEASASVKLDRNHRIALKTSFSSTPFTGQLAYTYTQYHQPNTGSAAVYWEPDWALTLTGRRSASESEAFHTLSVRITDLPSVTSSSSRSMTLRLVPDDALQVELAVQGEAWLAPSVYLRSGLRIGLSLGDVPESLLLKPSELRSIHSPRSQHVAAWKVAIDVPSPGPITYSVFHLAMIDEIRARLFLTLGNGWTSLNEFGTTSPDVEAGMEQLIRFSTLGGLLSMTARIGIATPIVGTGLTVLYGSISF